RKCGTKFLVSEPALAAAGIKASAEAHRPAIDEVFAFSQHPGEVEDTPLPPPITTITPAPPQAPEWVTPGTPSQVVEAKPGYPNRLVLGLVIAGSLLFVGLGITLAVVCFSADSPTVAEENSSS